MDQATGLFDRRSVLFLPASNPRAIARARESGADFVILDLEDAVKPADKDSARDAAVAAVAEARSEEHTSELQSLMRISYAVFCLKKKKTETKVITCIL